MCVSECEYEVCASQAESLLSPKRPSVLPPEPCSLSLVCVCECLKTHTYTQVRLTHTKSRRWIWRTNTDYLAGDSFYTHTHTQICARSQLLANAQTQSSCVFSVCLPTRPFRPSTPNLHPSRPCIPSIADTGAKGHVTYWIKPNGGPHAGRPDSLSAFSTCIVCKQTLTLTLYVCTLAIFLSPVQNNLTQVMSLLMFTLSHYEDLWFTLT